MKLKPISRVPLAEFDSETELSDNPAIMNDYSLQGESESNLMKRRNELGVKNSIKNKKLKDKLTNSNLRKRKRKEKVVLDDHFHHFTRGGDEVFSIFAIIHRERF